jgi:TetR/AcrR family transcriptional regulator, cholesterol catabolism regulator
MERAVIVAEDFDASPQTSTRDRILEIAAELFLERGYEGTSLNEIAQRLAISTPSLYWHFKSKQDLLYQFLRLEWEAFLASVEGAVTEGEPPARLAAMANAHVTHGLRRLPMSRAFSAQYSKAQLHRTLPAKQRRALGVYPSRYLTLCTGIIEAGIDDHSFGAVDPKMTAIVVINMCESVISWFDPKKTLTVDQVAAFYANSALRLVGVADLREDVETQSV